MDSTNRITELLTKYFSGSATESETEELERWRTRHVDNDRVMKDYKAIWDLAREEEPFITNTEKALKKVKQKLDERPTAKQRRLPLKWVARIAGLALVLAGTWLFMTFFIQNSSVQITEVSTMKGEKKEILLPDGTRVTLNGSSLLRHPERFAGEIREIWFEGEGYFSVAKNRVKPFVINSGEARVKVLGTAFNLRSRSSETHIKIAVTEGKVAFSERDAESAPTLLTAGEQAELDIKTKKIAKSETANENFLAWKTGKIVFKNTPLARVAADLSEYYQTPVVVQSDSVGVLEFTSVFDRVALEDALRIIELSMKVKADSTEGTIILTKNEE